MRLTKRHVEELLDTYDADPTAALAVALGRVLDRPRASWPELVAVAPVDDARRARLLAGDLDALDDLAQELNERRTLS